MKSTLISKNNFFPVKFLMYRLVLCFSESKGLKVFLKFIPDSPKRRLIVLELTLIPYYSSFCWISVLVISNFFITNFTIRLSCASGCCEVGLTSVHRLNSYLDGIFSPNKLLQTCYSEHKIITPLRTSGCSCKKIISYNNFISFIIERETFFVAENCRSSSSWFICYTCSRLVLNIDLQFWKF